jgi:methylenetetrahydrofolate dehydrogenase (NADP+) / methenyltetrahydrofolate cyclohydrolase
MAQIIDGKKLALSIRSGLADEVKELSKTGVIPGLAVVLVGENAASQVYVRSKKKACAKAGITSFSHDLPAETSEKALLDLIDDLNGDDAVHGILVQLPLPDHIDENKVIEAISPSKDVDGFHPESVGRLVTGGECFPSCTPAGIMALIESTGMEISGKNAVVVGRSNIVGKPVALMLLGKSATVTICHSRTTDLEEEVARADIVVAAVGRPLFIQGSWIKPGAVVIDVGINRLENGSLVGDVDFEGASERASFITPVPGGVGPMTIAMLLKNTVKSARKFK